MGWGKCPWGKYPGGECPSVAFCVLHLVSCETAALIGLSCSGSLMMSFTWYFVVELLPSQEQLICETNFLKKHPVEPAISETLLFAACLPHSKENSPDFQPVCLPHYQETNPSPFGSVTLLSTQCFNLEPVRSNINSPLKILNLLQH